MSIELLAPAGGPEPFRAALAVGADAIYCGVGNDFNARRNASNFDFDSFERACRAAHLAGTRVYVTINVAVADDELGRALALVREAAARGADAFIVQDWGLFELIHKTWPELELHVSTQANIHDARGTAWAREQGAHRVTLSRELSLQEIARIAQEGVELEVFGHGALCFCYSGVCLMSSMAGGRSANRGLCAQPCRLLYQLVDERGACVSAPGRTRPLCPKDACTADSVEALMAAGVGSLKVEGRMKAPDYVWSVVGAYREQIDSVLRAGGVAACGNAGEGGTANAAACAQANADAVATAGGTTTRASFEAGNSNEAAEERKAPIALPELGSTPVSAEVARRLKRAFNRDFTDAYLRGTSGDELMSYERSNNRGQFAGVVLQSSGVPVQRRDGKGNLHADPRQDKRRARCTALVRLDEPVGAGDLLELRPDDDPDSFLTATVAEDVPAGGTIECKVARPMPAGCPVRVIRSKAAHDGADAALAREVSRKRKVAVRVVARLGEPFRVELSCVSGVGAERCADEISELRGVSGKKCPATAPADCFGASAPVDAARNLPHASAEGFTVEPARTKAVTREDLIEHVGRMGTSPFEPVSFDVELDEGCGMGFSAVHKVRAAACEALEQAILAPYAERAAKLAPAPSLADIQAATSLTSSTSDYLGGTGSSATGEGLTAAVTASSEANGAAAVAAAVPASATLAAPAVATPEICVLAPTPEVAHAALEAGATRIYAITDALAAAGAFEPVGAPGEQNAAWPTGCIPVLDEVCREPDHARLDPWVTSGASVAVGNVSELALAAKQGAKPEVRGCIPVHNAAALAKLTSCGAAGVWLSPELTLAQISELVPKASVPVGLVVYGRVRVMTSEHCILQAANKCVHDCARCALRRRQLSLKDKDGRLLPVRTDLHGRSRIYDAAPLDLTPQVGELMAAGVSRLAVDATLLSPEQASAGVKRLAQAIAAVRAGKRPTPREKGSTSGHLFWGIG